MGDGGNFISFFYICSMIKINNKEYKFKFGFKALLMFEKETGESISQIGENMKMETIVDIAFCGMKSSGEKVTKDFIINAIDEDMSLINVFTEAMSQDMAAFNNIDAEAKK